VWCSFFFYRWTQIFYGREDTESDSEASRAPSYDPGSHYDHGMFSWIFAVFRIKYKFCFYINNQKFLPFFKSVDRDDQIRSKCGDDAVQYLSFQRHLIILMSIITLVSLGVALPINIQGDLKGDEKQFGHTTISNLDPS